MRRIKFPSFETAIHIVITEGIVNAMWYGIARLFTIQSLARDWGFVILSVFVIVVVGWYLGRRMQARFQPQDKKVVSTDNGQQKSSLSWLEQELSSDLQRIYKGMRGRVTRWDFSNIYNREPYFEIFVELTNTTIFTFCLREVSGFMKIAGEPCINPPKVSTRFGIKRDEPADIRVRQPIAPETVVIIQDAGNSNQEIEVNLGEVIFEIENTTEGYEKYKPYMTGGKQNIVPKDGLKIENKIEIDVHKHLVRKVGEPGYFPIDVEFTLKVPRLPIQFAKAQLCMEDEIIEPVTVSPTIPRTLEAKVERYVVRYEPTYEQFLKGRITSSNRERELKLRFSRARWTNEECKAHLRLTIEGKEEDFPEFTFDFESSRSQ